MRKKHSIVQSDTNCCYICEMNGASDTLEGHEPLGGSLRQLSIEMGLCVWLCGIKCHRLGKNSAHQNKAVNDKLRRDCQVAAMREYNMTEEQFINRFGKSYLWVGEE